MSESLDQVISSLNNKIQLLEGKYVNFVSYWTKMLEKGSRSLGNLEVSAMSDSLWTGQQIAEWIGNERQRLKYDLQYMKSVARTNLGQDKTPCQSNLFQIQDTINRARANALELAIGEKSSSRIDRDYLSLFTQLTHDIFEQIEHIHPEIGPQKIAIFEISKLKDEISSLKKSKLQYKAYAKQWKGQRSSMSNQNKLEQKLWQKEKLIHDLMTQNSDLKSQIQQLKRKYHSEHRQKSEEQDNDTRIQQLERQLAEIIDLGQEMIRTVEENEVPNIRLLKYESSKIKKFINHMSQKSSEADTFESSIWKLKYFKSKEELDQLKKKIRQEADLRCDMESAFKEKLVCGDSTHKRIEMMINQHSTKSQNILIDLQARFEEKHRRLSALEQRISTAKIAVPKRDELDFLRFSLQQSTNEKDYLQQKLYATTSIFLSSKQSISIKDDAHRRAESLQFELNQAEEWLEAQIEENQELQSKLDVAAHFSKKYTGLNDDQIQKLENKLMHQKCKNKDLKIRLSSANDLSDLLQDKYAAKISDFTSLQADLQAAKTEVTRFEIMTSTLKSENERFRNQCNAGVVPSKDEKEEYNRQLVEFQGFSDGLYKQIDAQKVTINELQSKIAKSESKIRLENQEKAGAENKLEKVIAKHAKTIQQYQKQQLELEEQLTTSSEKHKQLTENHQNLKQKLTEVRVSKTKEVERMEKKLVELREQLAAAKANKKSVESANQSLERNNKETRSLKIELDSVKYEYLMEQKQHEKTKQELRQCIEQYEIAITACEENEVELLQLQNTLQIQKEQIQSLEKQDTGNFKSPTYSFEDISQQTVTPVKSHMHGDNVHFNCVKQIEELEERLKEIMNKEHQLKQEIENLKHELQSASMRKAEVLDEAKLADEKLQSIRFQNEELKVQNGQLAQDFNATKQALDSSKTEILTTRAEVDMLKSQIQSLEYSAEIRKQNSQKLLTTEVDNERLTSKLQVMKRETENLQRDRQNVEKELVASVQDQAELQSKLTIKSTALEDAIKKLDEITSSNINQRRQISKHTENINELKEEVAKLNMENHELASTIQGMRLHGAGTNEAAKELIDDLSKLRTNLDIAEATIEKKTQTITDLNDTLTKTEESLAKTKQELQKSTFLHETLKTEKAKLEDEISRLRKACLFKQKQINEYVTQNSTIQKHNSKPVEHQSHVRAESNTVDDALKALKEQPSNLSSDIEELSNPMSIIFNSSSLIAASKISTGETDNAKPDYEILRLREEVFTAENILREKNELIDKLNKKLEKCKSELTANPTATSHFKEAFVKFVTTIPSHTTTSY